MHSTLSAVLVAAGAGTRMQHDLPKQFIELCGRPVITYSIEAFLKSFEQVEIIVVISKDFEQMMQDIAAQYFPQSAIHIVYGGASRFDSCRAGIHKASGDIVMVHDAARPMIDKELLLRLYHNAIQHHNAVPAIAPVESVRMMDADSNRAVDRDFVRLVQTPQAFDRKKLTAVYDCGFKPHFTDDASVWEAGGYDVHLVDGLRENIKMTTPQDLYWLRAILQERGAFKIT